MRIRLFITAGDEEPNEGRVTLLIPEAHIGDLPKHPNGGGWSYSAVIETEGENGVRLTRIALRALELQGFYMRRMLDDE